MRVGLVTPYPPAEHGIGIYSRELRRALERHDPSIRVSVFADRIAQPDVDSDVARVWDRRGDWVDELAAALIAARLDLVHFQHEEAVFGEDDRFTRLLARLRSHDIRMVVTPHTIHGHRVDLPFRPPGRRFHRQLAKWCDSFIVHQHAGMYDVLLSHGVPKHQIEVIAHGTPAFGLPDSRLARAQLGLPQDVPIAMCFGFIARSKNIHVAIEAFERAVQDVSSARLVIAGRIRRRFTWDEQYARALWRQMRLGIEAGRIIYRPGYIPDDQKILYYASADVLLLPYRQSYGSASGVLHDALGARRAIICSRGKKFAEAVEHIAPAMPFLVPDPGDIAAWEVGLERMLGHVSDRQRAVRLFGQLADVTSWQASATKHADLYRAVCSGITNMSQVG